MIFFLNTFCGLAHPGKISYLSLNSPVFQRISSTCSLASSLPPPFSTPEKQTEMITFLNGDRRDVIFCYAFLQYHRLRCGFLICTVTWTPAEVLQICSISKQGQLRQPKRGSQNSVVWLIDLATGWPEKMWCMSFSSEGTGVTVHSFICLKLRFKLAAWYFTYKSFSYQHFLIDHILVCNLHTVEILFPNMCRGLKQ